MTNIGFSLGPDQVICDGMPAIELDAGSLATTYLWNTNEITQTISVINEGVYSVSVTSPNNCTYTDEISLNNKFLPTLAFTTPDNNNCPPALFQLDDNSTPQVDDPIVTWNWTVNGQSAVGSTVNFSIPSSGTYAVSLEVTTQQGCTTSLTLNDYLTVHEKPNPNFITESNQISNCDKSVRLVNFTTDYDSLNWDFGDGFSTSEDTTTVHTYDEVGQYLITLNVVNEHGCENSFFREITPIKSIPFYTPNAFTPDGDELNEVFVPNVGCTDFFEFWVMNRWGEVIFYSNDVNVGWDGTYEGQVCPLGVYSWKAKYNGAKHNQIKLGEVHLMN